MAAASSRCGPATANAVPTTSRCSPPTATREQCAAGTTVETFCFKLTPGLAPLQGDPLWCAQRATATAPQPTPTRSPACHHRGLARAASRARLPDAARAEPPGPARRAAQPPPPAVRDASDAAARPEGDPCVPLAAVADERRRREGGGELPGAPAHLQQRGPAGPDPVPGAARRRVLQRDAGGPDAGGSDRFPESRRPGGRSRRGRVASPLRTPACRSTARTNAIRIRFSKPFAQGPQRADDGRCRRGRLRAAQRARPA